MDIKAQEAWAAPAFVRISGGAVGYSRADTRFRKPFRGLNGSAREVRVYIDAEFVGGRIGVHPNDNTAAVRLRADDLADIIRENGVTVEYTVI